MRIVVVHDDKHLRDLSNKAGNRPGNSPGLYLTSIKSHYSVKQVAKMAIKIQPRLCPFKCMHKILLKFVN